MPWFSPSTLHPGWVQDHVGANSLFSVHVDRDSECGIPETWGRLAVRRAAEPRTLTWSLRLCAASFMSVPGPSALWDSPPWGLSQVSGFALGLPAAWAGASGQTHSLRSRARTQSGEDLHHPPSQAPAGAACEATMTVSMASGSWLSLVVLQEALCRRGIGGFTAHRWVGSQSWLLSWE